MDHAPNEPQKRPCSYKKRKCCSGMYEQGKNNTPETALLITLGTEKASRGVRRYASASVWLNWREGRGKHWGRLEVWKNVTSEESLRLISRRRRN